MQNAFELYYIYMVGILLLAIFNVISFFFKDFLLVQNLFSILVFLKVYCSTFKYKKSFFLASLATSFSYLLIVFTGEFAELVGGYTPEINEEIFATGAVSRLCLYILIFYFVALVFYNLLGKYKFLFIVTNGQVWEKIILISSAICIGLVYCAFFIYGVPVFNGISRFEFWNAIVQNSLIIKAQYNLQVCSFFLFFILQKKKIVKYFLLLIIVSFVLSGEKFTPFIGMIISFSSVYFIRNRITNKKIFIKKIIAGCCCLIIFLIGTIFFQYNSAIDNSTTLNGVEATDMFFWRVVEQCQLWWVVDYNSDIIKNDMHIEELDKELDSLFSRIDDEGQKKEIGIYKLMYMFAGSDLVDRMYDMGIRFTAAYPALGLYYFGYIGLVFLQMFLGAGCGVFYFLFYLAIKRGDYFLLYILYNLQIKLINGIIMGNFYDLFSLSFVKFIVLAVVVICVRSRFVIRSK